MVTGVKNTDKHKSINSKSQNGCAMAQAVSRRPLTVVARVRTRVSPVGFVVDKVALGHVFLRVLWFSRQYHSTVGSTFPKIKKNSSFTHPFHSVIHSFILIWGRTIGP
jgi:hypothetical protein